MGTDAVSVADDCTHTRCAYEEGLPNSRYIICRTFVATFVCSSFLLLELCQLFQVEFSTRFWTVTVGIRVRVGFSQRSGSSRRCSVGLKVRALW